MKRFGIFATNVLLAGLLAAALNPVISSWLDQRHYQLEWKRDVFTRVVGNRHFLTDTCKGISSGEPFIALNEVILAFDDSPPVIFALKKYHEELKLSGLGRNTNNLVTLIKTMAKASAIRLDDLNDVFLIHPFTPQGGCGPQQ